VTSTGKLARNHARHEQRETNDTINRGEGRANCAGDEARRRRGDHAASSATGRTVVPVQTERREELLHCATGAGAVLGAKVVVVVEAVEGHEFQGHHADDSGAHGEALDFGVEQRSGLRRCRRGRHLLQQGADWVGDVPARRVCEPREQEKVENVGKRQMYSLRNVTNAFAALSYDDRVRTAAAGPIKGTRDE